MAKKISEWLKTVEHFKKFSLEELSTVIAFRDPIRPNYVDPNFFFSPVDGIILYQKIVSDKKESIVEVKGRKFSLQDLVQIRNYVKVPCLVIGIFLTFYDVHIVRIPYSGRLKFLKLSEIQSCNMPMLFTEKDILKGHVCYNSYFMDYLQSNERIINTIYNPNLDYTYYIVEIADADINSILHFDLEQNVMYSQNFRFSFIRWGSQVDLILPLDKKFTLNPLLENEFHVEAGIDKLVEIKINKNIMI